MSYVSLMDMGVVLNSIPRYVMIVAGVVVLFCFGNHQILTYVLKKIAKAFWHRWEWAFPAKRKSSRWCKMFGFRFGFGSVRTMSLLKSAFFKTQCFTYEY